MQNSDEIDLSALLRSIWKHRLLIAAATAFALVLAIVYLRIATFTYTAQLRVTAAQPSASEGIAGRLGALSGLASLAGINLQSGQATTDFQLYLESLRSREVADDLSAQTQLMAVIFPGEWDATTASWRKPSNPLGPLKNFVKRVLGIPVYGWQPPDGARLQEYLDVVIRVEQSPKTPVVTIRLDHKNPAFAVELLDAIHRAADDRLRKKAIARSTENIRYLSDQLAAVTVAEHRLAIAQALSEQEKTRMMSSATTPFAAEPFGAASVSRRATRPKPYQVLMFSLFGGLVLGTFVVVARQVRLARGD